MDRKLRGRQSENEPAIPDIHIWKTHNITKEEAVGIRFPAVDYRMCANNQRHLVFLFQNLWGCVRTLQKRL
jgi:hypothetical protein